MADHKLPTREEMEVIQERIDEQNRRSNRLLLIIAFVVAITFAGWVGYAISEENHKSQYQKCIEYQDRTADYSKDCLLLIPGQ